jgi:hypothetical protein
MQASDDISATASSDGSNFSSLSALPRKQAKGLNLTTAKIIW